MSVHWIGMRWFERRRRSHLFLKGIRGYVALALVTCLRVSLRVAAVITVLVQALAQRSDSGLAGSASSSIASVSPVAMSTADNSKGVLRAFGPYITQLGVGFGGANISEAYSGYPYGLGMQASAQAILADDFVVPAGASWTPTLVKWLSYQTGAPTTGTFSAAYLNLWNTDPTGQAPGGQYKTGGQVLLSQVWTGVYRVMEGNLTASNRAIIELSCSGSWIGTLGSGTYWLDCTADGTLSSGPWGPPETKPNQQPGQNPQWNGLASNAGSPFTPVMLGIEGQDFLFQVEGANGSPAKFCNSKPSSIPGCTPSLGASTPLASKSGAPAATVSAAPVPGGAGLPGILIYSKQAPVPPISTVFGSLCLAQLQRAGGFAAAPGGTPGNCNGSYTWDVAAIAAGTASITIGDELRIQGWYRDPPNPPGGANFTEGIDAIIVVP
jgi:hypothetical protein